MQAYRNVYWAYNEEGELDDLSSWSKQDRNDFYHSRYNADWSYAPTVPVVLEEVEATSEETNPEGQAVWAQCSDKLESYRAKAIDRV